VETAQNIEVHILWVIRKLLEAVKKVAKVAKIFPSDKYHLLSTDLIGGKVELHVICRRQSSWLEYVHYVGHLNDLEQFLALIAMHQLSIEGGYKLNKSKLTLAQKQSDSVLPCKAFQGFVLIYPLGWLCVGTKTIYHPEFS